MATIRHCVQLTSRPVLLLKIGMWTSEGEKSMGVSCFKASAGNGSSCNTMHGWGMNAGIRVWILAMPHVNQNLKVASLFNRHAKEQECK